MHFIFHISQTMISWYSEYDKVSRVSLPRRVNYWYSKQNSDSNLYTNEQVYIYGHRRRPKSIIAGEVIKHYSKREWKRLLNITYMQSVPEGKWYGEKLLYTLINKESLDAVLIRPTTEGSKALVKKIIPVLKEANIWLEIYDPDKIFKDLESKIT